MQQFGAAWHEPLWVQDTFGFLAGSLVLSTFSVNSMRRLRLLGIGSNVAFICYAMLTGMLPILILHALLLPINIVRLAQVERARHVAARVSRPELPITARGTA